MSHLQQTEFCSSVRERFPEHFTDCLVLDVGSLDINGNNQYLFDRCGYLGVDLAAGRNVDFVSMGHALSLPDHTFDTIISTECFEHDRNYAATLDNIIRLLKPGGMFLFTCATTGRPEHGTRRTTPSDAPFLVGLDDWGDYYRNLDEADIRAAVDLDAHFARHEFSIGAATHDLYFWGIKKGERRTRVDYSFQVAREISGDREAPQLRAENVAAMARLRARDRRVKAQRDRIRKLEGRIRELEGWLGRGPGAFLADAASDLWATVRSTWRKQTKKKARWAAGAAAVGPWVDQPLDLRDSDRVVILTTRHCAFVAALFQRALESISVKTEILFEAPPTGFADAPHIVICAQMFERLPEIYVAVQMEQSVSSRWFTEEYLDRLRRAVAVLDYSTVNIRFLKSRGIPAGNLFYLPLSILKDFRPPPARDRMPVHDVLFYGDPSCPRRSAILAELKKHFSVEVASEVFGEPLYEKIERAKVVVNIHYYENALLETTRIHECLSLGKVVVSEKGSDHGETEDLGDVVEFVEIGDVPALIAAVSRVLSDEEARLEKERAIRRHGERAPDLFQFHLLRLLLALGEIDFGQFYAAAGRHVKLETDRLCLTLPEYSERRNAFVSGDRLGFQMFTGLRHPIPWIGCGLSYKLLMRRAQDQGLETVTVCEDDVEFHAGFEERLARARDYLAGRQDWDIFSGLIADLHPEGEVTAVRDVDGERFVHLDRMTSMVLNVYHRRFFPSLLAWDESNLDVARNTIDRFIEASRGVKVVTTIPFLVGHKEDLHSTIWMFKNDTYQSVINRSSAALAEKVAGFLGDAPGERGVG